MGEMAVRRVDDRVDRLLQEVCANDLEETAADFLLG
jgi:hypothetical protein